MKYNIRLLVVILLIISFIFGSSLTLYASSSQYEDISGNWAEIQITDLINLNIIDGYNDKTIRPDNLITRAEFANILMKALDLESNDNISGRYFWDISPDDWYYRPTAILKQLSIIDGYSNNNYKPNNNITRAEMLTTIVKAGDGKLKLSNNTIFYKDVLRNHWAFNFVGIAGRAGLIAKDQGNLIPEQFVTRAEVFYSLDKMLWNRKSGSIVYPEELYKFVREYNTQLNTKYNSIDSSMDDLKNMTYGQKLRELELIAKRINLYKRMGINLERNINIYNPRLMGISYNFAKIGFDYDLSSKLIVGSTLNSINRSGMLAYCLKKSNESWVIYQENDVFSRTYDNGQIGKLNLVWDYVGSPISYFKGGKIEGLDVISPTWFNISDGYGNIESRANISYINNAHENGYQVWALFSNKFDPKLTSQVLNNSLSREKVLNKIVEYVDTYKLDGINVDFENMYKSDKDLFTQFIQELSDKLKPKGVILSVDVTIKVANSSWSDCYDRGALSEIVDYVAVMTYDQHWSTSPVSGSVAQLSWVEKGILGVLDEVPKEKLLLGIPFYTREWKEVETLQGVVVTSEAISMYEAQKRVNENNADKIWDNQSGQYYAQYFKDGAIYKIWLEDERSIDLKSQLVNKYDIGGTAAWKAGLEIKEIWDILKKNLNKT